MRIGIAQERKERIEKMIASGRCYYLPHEDLPDLLGNPANVGIPMFMLVRRLTTSLVIAPEYDLHPDSHGLLMEMLSRDLNFEGIFLDYEVFNALSYIPPQIANKPDSYVGEDMVGALILMLMIEFTINPNKSSLDKDLGSELSFFSFCRHAKLKLKSGEGYTASVLKGRFQEVLKSAKLLTEDNNGRYFSDLLKAWSEMGEFTVCGVKHSKSDQELNAHYLRLVKKMKDQGRLPLNDIISLSVGMEEMLTKKQMLDLPIADRRKVVFDLIGRLIENDQDRDNFIGEGDQQRKHRFIGQIYTEYPAVKLRKISQVGVDFFKEMLADIPESVLRIYEVNNTRIAYTSDNNLERLYPPKRLPGFTADDCKRTREAKGANLSRYGLMMVSRGNVLPLAHEEREIAERTGNPLLERNRRDIVYAQQTVLHESVHAAFSRLTLQDNYPDLYKEAIELKKEGLQVFKEIVSSKHDVLDQKCLILGGKERTVRDVFDLKTYNTYRESAIGDEATKDDIVAEEMFANLFGLKHSIFSQKNRPNFNPLIENDSFPELEKLVDIANRLDNLIERISFKLCGIDIPLGRFTRELQAAGAHWTVGGFPA